MSSPGIDHDDHPSALHRQDDLVLHDELLSPVVDHELARWVRSLSRSLRVPPLVHRTSQAPQGLGAITLVLRHRPFDPHDLVVAHRLRHELLLLDLAHELQDVVHALEVREADLTSLSCIDVVRGEATGVDDLEDPVLHDHLPLGLLPASEDDSAWVFSRRDMNRLTTARISSRGRSLRSMLCIVVSFETILYLHDPDVDVLLDGLDLLVHVVVPVVHLFAKAYEFLSDLVLEGVEGFSLSSLSSEKLGEHVLDIGFLSLSF